MQPIAETIIKGGFSDFEKVLMISMLVIFGGIAGLIVYTVKAALPRVLSHFDRMSAGVEAIPAAIKSFEVGLSSTENRLSTRISDTEIKLNERITTMGASIAAKIDDRRLEAIEAAVTRNQDEAPASRAPRR